jgi:hypothetical protein
MLLIYFVYFYERMLVYEAGAIRTVTFCCNFCKGIVTFIDRTEVKDVLAFEFWMLKLL